MYSHHKNAQLQRGYGLQNRVLFDVEPRMVIPLEGELGGRTVLV